MRCIVGLGSVPALAFLRPDLVGGRAGGLQLARGERLLGGVQQAVHLLPRGVRLLLRGANLRQPALLDHDQRGLEAPRQGGRANGAIERLPALRQLGVVDRRAGGELLGLDDERFGVGPGGQLLRPLLDAPLGLVQPRAHGVVRGFARLLAQRGELGRQRGERLRRCGRFRQRRQFGAACARSAPATAAPRARDRSAPAGPARAASQRATRAVSSPMSSACQRRLSSITAVRIGPGLVASASSCSRTASAVGGLALAIGDRVDALPREAGHAVILVPGGVGEPAQPVGRAHALRRGHARFRMLGGERDLDQRVFVADAGDRDAAALGVPRAACDVGADRVGAALGAEQHRGRFGVLRVGKRGAERMRERCAHCGIAFRFPGRGQRGEPRAALRRRGADLRRGVGRPAGQRSLRSRAAIPTRRAPAAPGRHARAGRTGRDAW